MIIIKIGFLYESINELGIEATRDALLKDHTSFKTGGTTPLLIEPKSKEEVFNALNLLKEYNVPFTVLGNGTNILALDEGTDKVIVKIADKMTELSLEGEDVISVSAGTKMVKLCKFALENSLSGLEFAYGIPGAVGGAVFMNAGAYGGEMKNVLTEITHITPDLKIETVKAEDAKLSYRHSVYKENGCIILSAKVKLVKGNKDCIKSAMEDFLSRRKDKQPLEYPSAGSTFKRPDGYFAGALIEQCGLKGKSIGGAEVSEKHSGFVINKNNATSKDILDLIKFVSETVKNETGVTLEPEVIVLK